ncbi:hypothetical protein OAU50_07090 [Planctomycetota bacterium]|nr:hypothetical protein [Planctomycetota bacterium]
MPELTEHQLKLLHAALDGEVTPDEDAEVRELLEDPGVQEYFDTCLKVRNLVKTHAPVKSPVNLKDSVLADIKSEAGLAPVHQLPKASWWAPLIGVAAAIIVVVAVTFGPSSPGTTPQGDAEVAKATPDKPIRTSVDDAVPTSRENVQNDPTLDSVLEELQGSERLKKIGETDSRDLRKELGNDGVNSDGDDASNEKADEVTESSLKKTGENAKLAKRTRRGENSDAESEEGAAKTKSKKLDHYGRGLGGGTGGGKVGHPPKKGPSGNAQREDAEEKNRDAGKSESHGSNGASGGAESDTESTDKKNSGWGTEIPAESAAPKAGTGGRVKRSSQGSTTPAPRAEDETDGQPENGKDRNVDPNAQPPAPPAAEPDTEAPADSLEDEAPRQQIVGQVIEVESPEGKKLAAQADLMWVSGIYGAATIDSDDDSDVESIAVEISAEQLPKLIAALKDLSKKQSYGEIIVDTKKQAVEGQVIKLTIRIK